MTTYSGLVHLNGNLLASIDLETTGLQAGYHEPIQIAVVPLNSDLRPLEGVRHDDAGDIGKSFDQLVEPMREIRRKLLSDSGIP